ncbi:MAG: hypothetical protein WC890_01820 [Candidatus Margulisiibacteriota bacterium]
MTLTGREKATIFLSILGAESAGRILRYLPEEVADLIAAGINHLPSPSPDALAEVLNEFKSFLALPSASKIPTIEPKSRPQAPKKSYSILMYERPQMVAFVLSLLSEDERIDALNSMVRDKSLLEELLTSLRVNPLTNKIGDNIKELFGERLFK